MQPRVLRHLPDPSHGLQIAAFRAIGSGRLPGGERISIGWAFLVLLTVCALRPRMSRADDGVDVGSSDMTTSDSGVDAGVSEPLMQACLCAASPGASSPLQVERMVAQPLTDLRARACLRRCPLTYAPDWRTERCGMPGGSGWR